MVVSIGIMVASDTCESAGIAARVVYLSVWLAETRNFKKENHFHYANECTKYLKNINNVVFCL